MAIHSGLKDLCGISAFPGDYARDDLIQYVTLIETYACPDGEPIDTPNARIKELEKRIAGSPQVALT